jgi:hypothetical protein
MRWWLTCVQYLHVPSRWKRTHTEQGDVVYFTEENETPWSLGKARYNLTGKPSLGRMLPKICQFNILVSDKSEQRNHLVMPKT